MYMTTVLTLTIITYDGDCEAFVTDKTTQIVVPKDCDAKVRYIPHNFI